MIKNLVLINSPHPVSYKKGLEGYKTQRDIYKYVDIFSSSRAHEIASRHDFFALRTGFFDKDHLLSDGDRADYTTQWSDPARLTKMLNIYADNYDFFKEAVWESKISVPTLLLWGSNDSSIIDEIYLDMAHNFNDFASVKFDEKGHWALRSESCKMASQIIRILRK